MGLSAFVAPINRNQTGYGLGQQLPVTGATAPPPKDATPAQVGQWLAAQPWYQSALKAWNVNPNDVALNLNQRNALADAATRAGATLGGDLGVNSSGQLENTQTQWWAKAILAATTVGIGASIASGAQNGIETPNADGGTDGALGGGDYGQTSGATDPGGSVLGGNQTGPNPTQTELNAGGGNPATSNAATSWLTQNGAKVGTGVLPTALNAFSQIYGANKAADASAAGQQIQSAEFDKALAATKEEQDYKRGQFSSYTARLQPYANTGYAADDRLSQFMGQPAAARTGVQSLAPAGSTTGTPPPAATTPDTPPPSGMVTLQAPDGTLKTVPAADAAYYISKGAKPAAAPAGT